MVFLFLLDRPWDHPSLIEINIENYKNPKTGIIKKIELGRGCALHIELKDPNRKFISFKKDTASYSLVNDCNLTKQIQRRDYFQKLPESNKCFIIRNDSVLLFDCNTNFEYQLKDSIEKIETWDIKGHSQWKKMPYEPIEKYLKNKQYEEYKSHN